ncbi:MAG: DMT family transporter [Pseudonocardia sp.]|nr:DMT family transporter [Pseudonocardia sp.]
MDAALLGTALVIGGLLTVQASANLQLTKTVGTPYGAATLQLWVAVALLTALAALVGGFPTLTRIADAPLWYLLGGLASPLYITSGILLFPRVGALAAGGLFVVGQLLASVSLDLFGLLGLPRQPLNPGIVTGSLAVLAGITVIVRGPRRAPATVGGPGLPPPPVPGSPAGGGPAWLLLGLVAGAVLPVQGALNAQLRTAVEQPVAVGLVSFLVAAVAITAVLVVLRTLRRTPAPRWPSPAMPWWGWLGGLCAAAYVTGTFLLIPAIGAAVTVALTVTGQQLASATVDARGWFRLPRRPLTGVRAGGLALLVAGSLLVQLS